MTFKPESDYIKNTPGAVNALEHVAEREAQRYTSGGPAYRALSRAGSAVKSVLPVTALCAAIGYTINGADGAAEAAALGAVIGAVENLPAAARRIASTPRELSDVIAHEADSAVSWKESGAPKVIGRGTAYAAGIFAAAYVMILIPTEFGLPWFLSVLEYGGIAGAAGFLEGARKVLAGRRAKAKVEQQVATDSALREVNYDIAKGNLEEVRQEAERQRVRQGTPQGTAQ
ncbi:hypothetical protein HYS47_00850 [Candidatus Woesearchaeota archaeon]|nr:hypothetical protein [Candidatus Woesearchaeota archaeon]